MNNSTSNASLSNGGEANAEYYEQARPEMLTFVPITSGRVLDVGCGQGTFATKLKTLHPQMEVWGVEPVETVAKHASHRLDKVLTGLFDRSLELQPESLDLIIFNDSLEHMPDHVEALALAHDLLKCGGAIMASIPNVRYWPHVQHYLIDGDWQYQPYGILDHTHLRFFTRKSMIRAFTAAGFSVDRVEGINQCWTGVKFKLLRLMFPRIFDDMPFSQFAVVAHKPSPTGTAIA